MCCFVLEFYSLCKDMYTVKCFTCWNAFSEYSYDFNGPSLLASKVRSGWSLPYLLFSHSHLDGVKLPK